MSDAPRPVVSVTRKAFACQYGIDIKTLNKRIQNKAPEILEALKTEKRRLLNEFEYMQIHKILSGL